MTKATQHVSKLHEHMTLNAVCKDVFIIDEGFGVDEHAYNTLLHPRTNNYLDKHTTIHNILSDLKRFISNLPRVIKSIDIISKLSSMIKVHGLSKVLKND